MASNVNIFGITPIQTYTINKPLQQKGFLFGHQVITRYLYYEVDCNSFNKEYNISWGANGTYDYQTGKQYNVEGVLSISYYAGTLNDDCADYQADMSRFNNVYNNIKSFFGDTRPLYEFRYTQTNLNFNQNIGEYEVYKTEVIEIGFCSPVRSLIKSARLNCANGICKGDLSIQVFNPLN